MSDPIVQALGYHADLTDDEQVRSIQTHVCE
jgi:hypothetical protein